MNIEGFSGEYRFLSNFFPVKVMFDGEEYRSVENAYQAAKSDKDYIRSTIRKVGPGEAKRIGRNITVRPGWDQLRLVVMRELLEQKFQHSELREKLLATGDVEIIERNSWGDSFWGETAPGVGSNHLGRLLMEIREAIKTSTLTSEGGNVE